MDPDELTTAVREQASAEVEAARKQFEAELEGLTGKYPQLTSQLRDHYARCLSRREAEWDQFIARLHGGKTAEPSERAESPAEADKREAWEFLTLLAQAEPDLPIASMHNEYCARLDAAQAELERLRQAAIEEMNNILMDWHGAKAKKNRQE